MRYTHKSDLAAYEIHHDSISDLMRDTVVTNPEEMKREWKRWTKGNEDKCFDFKFWKKSGSDYTHAQCEALLKDPRKPTLNAIAGFTRMLNATPSFRRDVPKRIRRRGLDAGDDMSLDRFMQRDPMLWEKMTKEPMPHRVITIANQINSNCNESEDAVMWRGAAVCALGQWLHKNDYGVEMKAVCWDEGILRQEWNGSRECLNTITVKSANMPLNISNVATVMCDLMVCRVKVFETWMRLSPPGTQLVSSLGRSRAMPDRVREALKIDHMATHNIRDRRTAEAWIKECMVAIKEGKKA